jgi:hypothetical protein
MLILEKNLNFLLYKRPSSEYNSLKKRSLRKRPKSNTFGEHLEKLKGGMSSDAIEGEPSHLETNHIFSPSMLITDISFESISNPSLTPINPLMLFLLSLMMILKIH